ncbi:hypothetical protein ILUMI_04539 [Ignelater luminosus]|uniref:E2 ubiquitin-conjugating enzyme n=1 Tax=Ignelater luminosus TaxID=2038154 RepID=A0A8K0D9H5_IGNLU|nr:hypothetical protein ILUMI_04539 [Ignelater luminosus]
MTENVSEGGFFKCHLHFPKEYPLRPPKMRFVTEIWHPNIDKNGDVCISILHEPGDDKFGYEKASERWLPVHTVETILISVISMLADPNDESPANVDAAKEWRESYSEFKRKVARCVRKSQEEWQEKNVVLGIVVEIEVEFCDSSRFSTRKMNFQEVVQFVVIDALGDIEEAANRPPRRFQRRESAFDLPDHRFVKMFRLTKPLVRELIETLQLFIVPPSRTSALDVETKVLTTLRFYASGSYQLDTASNKHFCMMQSSASQCINEVTETLNQDAVLNRWIRFPRNMNELHDLRQHFYQRYGFPGVIGCIDCTHIAIVAPKENDALHPEHIYINRKNYHSINVQLICDHNLKILNVNARYPGSTHDAYIWHNSAIQPLVENIYRRNQNNLFYLLGD